MSKVKEDIVTKNLKGFIRKGANAESQGCIPTGHFALDFAIHYGSTPDKVDWNQINYDPNVTLGIPRGRMVEIYGEEGGGKSSLAHRVVGFAQKMGLKCAWIDTENSYAENLAELNGVDVSEVYYSDMSNREDAEEVFYAEHIFDAIIDLCKNDVKVIVVDSVANMVPKARMEKDAEQATVGLVARLMSENLGKVASYAAKHGVLVIFINQLREKIGVMFGNPETTPGGRSLKHNSSLRLQVSKNNSKSALVFVEDESTGEPFLIGRKTYVRLVKNRFAKPCLDSLEITIYYEPYFPDVEELMFDSGRQIKLISVRKGVFSWGDIKVEGRKGFVDHIKANGLQCKLYEELIAASGETGTILPPEIVQWAESKYKPTEKQSVEKKTLEKKTTEKNKDAPTENEE